MAANQDRAADTAGRDGAQRADALLVSDQAEQVTSRRLSRSWPKRAVCRRSIRTVHLSNLACGLMAYGIDNVDFYRRGADYVDWILKGARSQAKCQSIRRPNSS